MWVKLKVQELNFPHHPLQVGGVSLHLQKHVQTLFSCPTGRFLTVPVTLMTDSGVRLHNVAFKVLGDLKQRKQTI